MLKPINKTLTKVLVFLAIVLLLVLYSAFRAYRVSDRYIQNGISIPFYGIRPVFYPNRHIDGIRELGFAPGWLVTYAPRSRNYGTALFVSPFGLILASGTPSVVTKVQQQALGEIEKFKRSFAIFDATIHVGMTFSNIQTLKGLPLMITNTDGTITAIYLFMPRAENYVRVNCLTDSIDLSISNGIVISKGYGYEN